MITIEGNIVDIHSQRIYAAELKVQDGKILSVEERGAAAAAPYIMPGFIDAHVHIESSMLVPAQFARLAVVQGTVATISDPHEIANVCGMEGVTYMIENGLTVPFKFHFGVPSCVPATSFETAGATINVNDVDSLLQRDDILYLSEMMNFPGVLHGDPEVMKKIELAQKYGKPVDGHAPGLRGEALKKYVAAGISTDHECFTEEEASEKLQLGMKILIREGSAAKNFEALVALLNHYPDAMMFCSDDKHPDSLAEGHINQLCARAVAKGIDLFKVLKAACVNPVKHYKLKVGLLNSGDPADFIIVENLQDFTVLKTYINGTLVAENGESKTNLQFSDQAESFVNQFDCSFKEAADFSIRSAEYPRQNNLMPVIEALDGQLITNKLWISPLFVDDLIVSDVENDVLKIVVVNRYQDAPVAKAFIKNFGIRRGAIASSVAHDSHNIVAVGVDDESICRAVNSLIKTKGGVSCIDGDSEQVLPLPVAGLMSVEDGYKVAEMYQDIDKAAKSLGSKLSSPYMTLSFMALLVIPELKLSDKGLFDGKEFRLLN
ncbi:adenine deaminase [Desertivirga xinjiangensis]|uniref:adenine deaminase n=1 Tax=Desertivirga xinjiangensis TaxID=539206 RepID=UPI0021094CDB|nr:adenine deaminase [Pedobacter xinjiangensis]